MGISPATTLRGHVAVVAAVAAVTTVAGVGAAMAGGCAKKHPPVASSNLVLTPEEASQRMALTRAEKSDALAAMRSVTGPPPQGAPRFAPAAERVRWSDIPLAVGAASGEPGVELTVMETRATPDRYEFELRTLENWPGRLVIARGEAGQVYVIEEVSIGRFPDEPARVARAEALVEAFEQHLQRLGRQAWFND